MSSVRSLSLLQVRRTASHSPLSGYLISRVWSPSPHIHHPQHGRRAFHWQSTANVAIDGAQNLMVGLHSVTHLPWFLTIPLVAFTVGAVFRLPFMIHSQIVLRRRTELGPVMQAWITHFRDSIQREQIPPSRFMSEVKSRQDEASSRIYSKLGLQQWRLYGSVLGFPVWIIAIDAVRRLCGGPVGLVGSLITGAAGVTDNGAPARAGSVVDSSTMGPAAMDPGVISPGETIREAVVDPSLTFEGCLWFTDLTASDPYHILPFALSATLIFNLLPKTGGKFYDRLRTAMGRRPQNSRSQLLAEDKKVGLSERVRSTLRMAMFGLAIMIGPATLDLPAALHLYWLTSSMSNALFVKVLNHLLPVKWTLRKRCTGVETPFLRPQRNKKYRASQT
ncbi:hypothetical protein F4861DRAFT_19692 [Xylaria intraflava]|nr:hypothetical protein F4861DRAFT_19692 [Xylaria intraflava]